MHCITSREEKVTTLKVLETRSCNEEVIQFRSSKRFSSVSEIRIGVEQSFQIKKKKRIGAERSSDYAAADFFG